MKFKISNTSEFKLKLLTITLLVNFCASWYLNLSNQLFEQIIAISTLFLSVFHAILYIIFNKNRKQTFYWLMIYVLLFFLYRYCKRREVLDLFTYVSFYSNVDFRLINKKIKTVTVFFFIGTILLNAVHILPTAPAFYRGSESRLTLGFNHPNSGGFFSLIIAGCLFVQDYEKRRLNKLLVMILLGLETYFIFNCRTAFFSIIAIIIIMIVKIIGLDFFKKLFKKKIIQIFIVSLFLVLVVGLVYLSDNFNKYSELNTLLSSRLENNNLFLHKYNITLFGNPNVPTWILGNDNWGLRYLDSGYLQILLSFGIINTIIYILLLYKSLVINLKAKEVAVVIWDIIIMLTLIVEASPLRWYFAIPILYVFNNKKNDMEKK
ncbi:hypothetical protein ACTQ1L_07495 [Agathobacter sp. LCP21S3_B2]|uniref:hypothetical protein n=1 Tax=Agathobacter sp. LCP21S3_B2 TaxID=3438734 RepID=UPI003F8D936F